MTNKLTPVMIGLNGGRNLVSAEVDLRTNPNDIMTTVAQVLVHVTPADAKKHGGHRQAYEAIWRQFSTQQPPHSGSSYQVFAELDNDRMKEKP